MLLLAGADNTWTGEKLETRHAEHYPNAQLVVIPDAGYDMFWDNPTDTIGAIRSLDLSVAKLAPHE